MSNPYYFYVYPRTGGGVEAICNVEAQTDKSADAKARVVFTKNGFDLKKYRVGLGREHGEWYHAAVARGVRVIDS